MAYTTEVTIVTGTTIQSSWANTYVRDNVEWVATSAPCCRVFNSATISHASSGSYQALTFDSERFDTGSMHSTVSNTSRVTVPASSAGKYLIGGCIEFAGSAAGNRAAGLKINGATFIGQEATAGSANGNDLSPHAIYSFAVADYVELLGFQASGGALNMTSNPNIAPEFWAFWMRN